MKNYLKAIIIFITLLILSAWLAGCDDKPFTGRIVAKEYTPEHQCCSNPTVKLESAVTVRPIIVVPPAPHHHQTIAESYVWYVANYRMVRKFIVTKEMYNTKSIGQKVTLQ